ncbi:hypothetical protein, partial [Bacillus cereus]
MLLIEEVNGYDLPIVMGRVDAWVRWSDEKITSDSLGGREQAQRQDWTQMINWEGEYATSTKG